VLSGDARQPNGSHSVDEFDEYTYEASSGKYKGFSFLNDGSCQSE